VVCALATVALTGGCGFLGAPAASPSQAAAPSSTPAPASVALPSVAELVGSLDGRPASLTVSVADVQRDVPPVQTLGGGLLGQDCRLDPATTEYAKVTLVFTAARAPRSRPGRRRTCAAT
jgi:hypothetical protein